MLISDRANWQQSAQNECVCEGERERNRWEEDEDLKNKADEFTVSYSQVQTEANNTV